MRSFIPKFRDPSALTVRERHAEIVDILSRGLGRYAAELPVSRASDLGTTDDAPEVSQNQLDAHVKQSVYAPDGNT
jgi:hypothetical protein